MLAELNNALADEVFTDALLMMSNPTESEILEAICTGLTPASAATARSEFTVLPRSFLHAVLDGIDDAVSGEQVFEIISAPPDFPVDAARHGRVEWRTVYDEEGVKMIISHIHNRHAAWFAHTEAVAT